MAPLRQGLLNRTGLALLALSCVLAAAMLVLPPLASWSPRATQMVGIGLLAYVLTVLIWAIPAPIRDGMSNPAMVRLLDIRQQMAKRLAELRSASVQRQSPLIPVVAEALRHMDTELVPTMRSIVVRHEELEKQLSRYQKGQLTPPDRQSLDRLERIYARQDESIGACVQQAANAYATLLALLQESDTTRVVADARLWTADLNDIYEGLADVLSGVDPYEQAMIDARIGDAEPAQLRVEAGTEQPVAKPQLAEPAAEAEGPVQPEPSPPRAYPDGLTQREAEVLALLADGLASKEIADELVVTVATVSRHIANIYTKIDVRGRAGATRYAIRNGITRERVFLASRNGGSATSGDGRGRETPSVASFRPTSGPARTVVKIAGTGFSGATAVKFSGVAATVATVDSPTQITAVVPALASSGPISVTTPAGTATSVTSFAVTRQVTPASATSGATRPGAGSDGRAR